MRGFVALIVAIAVGASVWASEPLKGWVVDRNGAPIEGAKVYVEFNKNSVTSNDGGEFCLSDVGATETLYVKVKKKVYDISVGGRKTLYVVISDLPVERNEKKIEDIGTNRIVTGEELVKSGHTDLVKALGSRFAGVYVDGYGGITMSRACSLVLSPSPAWIVDGVFGVMPSTISIYDVESIEIDKEGLGYGLRAPNGVIIVKTKRVK